MSLSAVHHGIMFLPANAGPIWRLGTTPNPATINEGDDLTFLLQCLNPRPGARIRWYMLKASGNTIGEGNWVYGLIPVVKQAVEAAGLSFLRLTANTVPKANNALDFMISVPEGSTYNGSLIEIKITAKKNRKDDIDPRTGRMALLQKIDGGDPDTTRGFGGGDPVTIRDTSKSPTNTPTYKVELLDPSGTAPTKSNLVPGESFKVRVTTSGIIPGTKMKLYAANDAQYYPSPRFRSVLLDTLKAAEPRGITFEQTKFPPPAGEVWYNGYTAVFGDAYDNSGIEFDLTIGEAKPDGSPTQLDILATITAEGTVSDMDTVTNKGNWDTNSTYAEGDYVFYQNDGGTYVAISGVAKGVVPTNTTYWREYIATQRIAGTSSSVFAKLPPPRYWEIRAVSDGATIRYAVRVPVGATGSRVSLQAVNAPSGFAAAIAAAMGATGSPASFDGTTITATADASFTNCDVTWSVPHAGAGKHTLRLFDADQSPITIGDACVFLTALAPLVPADPKYVVGVNNAGGDFTGKGGIPGQYVTDYEYPVYPQRADAAQRYRSFEYLWGMGFRIMRLPMRWGRVQRDGLFTPLFGEKDPAAPWTGGALDIARIDDMIDWWTSRGGVLLLDSHDYGGGDPTGGGGSIGYDRDVGVDALVDFWVRLASRYEGNPRVWFGLVNEPSGSAWNASRCRENMQWLVNAIRSKTNARNKILVGGQGYSSAANWVSSGQGDAYADFYDPAGNFAFEPHCYFDADASGRAGTCSTNAQNRLTAITTWARANGFKLFLGEVAGGDPTVSGQQTCGTVVPAAYRYMRTNKDVWLGWTTWGYGPKLSSVFTLNPLDYTSYTSQRPCMDMLKPEIAAEY